MKHYIAPLALRRGNPVLHMIEKDKNKYYLLTYHDIMLCEQPPYKGIGEEYEALSKKTISKQLYNAFVREIKIWKKKCKKNGMKWE